MITQSGSKLLIEIDDNVAAEMAEAMAAGLNALPASGIFTSRWTAPRCLAGCCLRWDEETDQYFHAPACPLPLALSVARLCSEVLANLKLIDKCLNSARQEAEAVPQSAEAPSAEEKPMDEEPTIHEFQSAPPVCPHCEKAGKRSPLTPKGRELECPVCGNVFWASDPAGARSRNELPK